MPVDTNGAQSLRASEPRAADDLASRTSHALAASMRHAVSADAFKRSYPEQSHTAAATWAPGASMTALQAGNVSAAGTGMPKPSKGPKGMLDPKKQFLALVRSRAATSAAAAANKAAAAAKAVAAAGEGRGTLAATAAALAEDTQNEGRSSTSEGVTGGKGGQVQPTDSRWCRWTNSATGYTR